MNMYALALVTWRPAVQRCSGATEQHARTCRTRIARALLSIGGRRGTERRGPGAPAAAPPMSAAAKGGGGGTPQAPARDTQRAGRLTAHSPHPQRRALVPISADWRGWRGAARCAMARYRLDAPAELSAARSSDPVASCGVVALQCQRQPCGDGASGGGRAGG